MLLCGRGSALDVIGSRDDLFCGAVSHSEQCSTLGNKGCGMYYPDSGMVHMKDPLLIMGKSSL